MGGTQPPNFKVMMLKPLMSLCSTCSKGFYDQWLTDWRLCKWPKGSSSLQVIWHHQLQEDCVWATSTGEGLWLALQQALDRDTWTSHATSALRNTFPPNNCVINFHILKWKALKCKPSVQLHCMLQQTAQMMQAFFHSFELQSSVLLCLACCRNVFFLFDTRN